ncbi:ProA domain protein [Bacillus sp. AFS018417]|uniref:ProA domain protein n=1 Tax=Bacillus TaxID=1386 RepID=UPI000BF76358|nr:MULTISPECIES: ProA domain protein [unclassified Bacillus (in: firmicutes)]MCP1125496.1 ProA domain protein [Bacillus sp. 3103sda1]PEZ10539.1 ProA domain protein [Bacillus sp. AFS018417]
MESHERIILDLNGQEIDMVEKICAHFKEKHGVELSHGALFRDLMDIEYIRITEGKHKYEHEKI